MQYEMHGCNNFCHQNPWLIKIRKLTHFFFASFLNQICHTTFCDRWFKWEKQLFFIQHYLKYNCIISRKCNGKEWASNYLTLKVKMWHCGIFKIALLFFENVQHNNEAKTKWFNFMILISHGFWCQKLLHSCISYCIKKLLSLQISWKLSKIWLFQ